MRLAPRKRPAALVELVAEAARLAGPGSVSLTVLGEGPDRRKVEALVRERRLDWVSLPGRVPRDELRQLYAAADVYLSPARLESFGLEVGNWMHGVSLGPSEDPSPTSELGGMLAAPRGPDS